MLKLKKATLYILSLLLVFCLIQITAPAAVIDYIYDDLYRLKKVTYQNGPVIEYSYDDLGNRTVMAITSSVLPGDVNGDGVVTLADVVAILKLLGADPTVTINSSADANGDAKIGMLEAIYVLEKISGLR